MNGAKRDGLSGRGTTKAAEVAGECGYICTIRARMKACKIIKRDDVLEDAMRWC